MVIFNVIAIAVFFFGGPATTDEVKRSPQALERQLTPGERGVARERVDAPAHVLHDVEVLMDRDHDHVPLAQARVDGHVPACQRAVDRFALVSRDPCARCVVP